MQVVVGTLESLAKGVSSSGFGQCAQQSRRRRRAGCLGCGPAGWARDADPSAGRPARATAGSGARAGLARRLAAVLQLACQYRAADLESPRRRRRDKGGGFGSVMVTPAPGKKDEINRILNDAEGKGGEPAEGQREASAPGRRRRRSEGAVRYGLRLSDPARLRRRGSRIRGFPAPISERSAGR